MLNAKMKDKFRERIMERVHRLMNILQPCSQGLDRVWKNIENEENREQIEASLAPLRVAKIFSAYPEIQFEFEAPRRDESDKRPLDLVIKVGSIKVANEVKYVCESTWRAPDISKPRGFIPIQPEPEYVNESQMSLLVALVGDKIRQIENGVPNIIWFVTQNILVDAEDVGSVARHLREAPFDRNPDLVKPPYALPPDLTALGWTDGDPSSSHCFMLRPHSQVEELLRSSGVCFGKECIHCSILHQENSHPVQKKL